MKHRFDYMAAAPQILQPLFEMSKILAACDLEPNLLALVQMRASQINGCAFCLALHGKEAVAFGEPLERITTLSAWRETPWFSERERVALEWTESVVKIAQAHPDEDLLERARKVFSDADLAHLSFAVAQVTAYNQLNVAFGTSPEFAEAVFQRLHGNGVHA